MTLVENIGPVCRKMKNGKKPENTLLSACGDSRFFDKSSVN